MAVFVVLHHIVLGCLKSNHQGTGCPLGDSKNRCLKWPPSHSNNAFLALVPSCLGGKKLFRQSLSSAQAYSPAWSPPPSAPVETSESEARCAADRSSIAH